MLSLEPLCAVPHFQLPLTRSITVTSAASKSRYTCTLYSVPSHSGFEGSKSESHHLSGGAVTTRYRLHFVNHTDSLTYPEPTPIE